MGKREAYEPWTFCWVELSTTDVDLLGWEFRDDEIPRRRLYDVPPPG